jgi:IPT/TIG domain/Repeat of unknown function (DUF5907)
MSLSLAGYYLDVWGFIPSVLCYSCVKKGYLAWKAQQVANGGNPPAPIIPPPYIIDFNPTSGQAGDTITVYGLYLDNSTQVRIGSIACTGLTIVSDREVTAIIPSGATRNKVTVVNPSGTHTSTIHWIPGTGGGGGSGDMLKSTYDTNNNGVVDRATTIDGLSSAGNRKYVGTNASGTAGIHSLPATPTASEIALSSTTATATGETNVDGAIATLKNLNTSKQDKIQFKADGNSLGSPGDYNTVDLTGAGVELVSSSNSREVVYSIAADMKSSVYDTDQDGVVDEAETIAGLSTAGNNKYVGTNGSGSPGIYSLPSAGIADPGSNGLLARTALNSAIARTLTPGSSKVSISNGNGVSGNPTINIVEANLALENIGGSISITQIPNNLITYAKLQNVAANSVLANNTATSGSVVEVGLAASQLFGRGSTGNLSPISLGTNLSMSGTILNAASGIADPGANGLLARTALNAATPRTITPGSTKVSISNGDGVSGNPTIDLVEANLNHANIGGTVGTAQIAAAAVTYAKIQNVAANSVLANNTAASTSVTEVALSASQLFGRGSTGNLAPIALGTNLSMSGTTLNATGLASGLAEPATNGIVIRTGTGTTTARTLTPGSSKVSISNGDGVSGNPTIDLVEANLNHANIGGTVGTAQIAAAAVTYAKIQNVSANSVLANTAATNGTVSEVSLAASQLFGRGSTGNLAPITLGSNLSMSGTTLNASGGSGLSYVLYDLTSPSTSGVGGTNYNLSLQAAGSTIVGTDITVSGNTLTFTTTGVYRAHLYNGNFSTGGAVVFQLSTATGTYAFGSADRRSHPSGGYSMYLTF